MNGMTIYQNCLLLAGSGYNDPDVIVMCLFLWKLPKVTICRNIKPIIITLLIGRLSIFPIQNWPLVTIKISSLMNIFFIWQQKPQIMTQNRLNEPRSKNRLILH
jgi:hypothetical protein